MSSKILPGLRRAAPRLSKDFFACHRYPALQKSLAPQLQSNFFQSTRFSSNTVSSNSIGGIAAQAQRSLGEAANLVNAKTRYPEVSSKSVAYWLLGSAASVFGIVVFGGLTRLTESGYICA